MPTARDSHAAFLRACVPRAGSTGRSRVATSKTEVEPVGRRCDSLPDDGPVEMQIRLGAFGPGEESVT